MLDQVPKALEKIGKEMTIIVTEEQSESNDVPSDRWEYFVRRWVAKV